MSAERRDVQEFEVNEAILQIRDDFSRDKIDAECMEREIDLALRGLVGASLYLSPFDQPRMTQVSE